MKINSILVKGLIAAYNISEEEIIYHFKIKKNNFPKSVFSGQEYMVNASVIIHLLELIRKKYPDDQEFYKPIFNMNILDIGLFGQFLLNCTDLDNAFSIMERYQLLVCDYIDFKYERDRDHIYCITQLPYNVIQEENNLSDLDGMIDFEMIIRHRLVECLLGKKIIPQKILINENYYYPKRTQNLERLFGCEVQPHPRQNIIIYSSKILKYRLAYSNFTAFSLLEPVVTSHFANIINEDTYREMIQRLLLNNLVNFPLTIDMAARGLLMSKRKLQKILQKENTTYIEITNGIKMKIAVMYLSKGYKIKEIAQKLGYQETNSFSRSFKKWFDMTPNEYAEKVISRPETPAAFPPPIKNCE
jgi:AraC-like DNA-binding protein